MILRRTSILAVALVAAITATTFFVTRNPQLLEPLPWPTHPPGSVTCSGKVDLTCVKGAAGTVGHPVAWLSGVESPSRAITLRRLVVMDFYVDDVWVSIESPAQGLPTGTLISRTRHGRLKADIRETTLPGGLFHVSLDWSRAGTNYRLSALGEREALGTERILEWWYAMRYNG